MILRTLNPYTLIGTQHTAGLDAIATAFGATGVPTTGDFAKKIAEYTGGIYYPPLPLSARLSIQLESTAIHALNGYVNSVIKSNAAIYATNLTQFYFVDKMLKSVLRSPINEILDIIIDIEDNITKCDLSVDDQVPLLLATEIGKRNIAYWLPKISTPGNWAIFFDTNSAINTTNIPFWVSASMEGTLLMANRSASYPLVDGTTTPNAGVDLASALGGGLALGAGKVIYRMIKRITVPGQMSSDDCSC